MTVNPFPMVEMAVKELVETYEPAKDHTGGDLAYDSAVGGLYFWIGLVPSGGSTDMLEGDWAVDIDVFAPSYGEAMQASLALEAAIIGPRKPTSVLRLDNVYQNTAPSERPWDDENAFRVGGTYVFTARRPG